MQRRGPRRARSGCERAMARLSQKGGKRRVAWSLSLFPSPSPGLSPLPRALLTPPCALYTMRENQRSAQRRQQHGRPSATVGHCRCVACAVERRKRVAFFFFLLQLPPFFFSRRVFLGVCAGCRCLCLHIDAARRGGRSFPPLRLAAGRKGAFHCRRELFVFR